MKICLYDFLFGRSEQIPNVIFLLHAKLQKPCDIEVPLFWGKNALLIFHDFSFFFKLIFAKMLGL